MNAALTVLFTNHSRLFVDNPRAAFLLRTSNWKVRHAFDRLSDPVVWWLWIHHFFIPNITGLPADLPTRFYRKILKKHFKSVWYSSWEQQLARWERERCNTMQSIGRILVTGSCPDRMARYILYWLDDFFVTTAKGRAFFLRMVDEWGECFEDNEKISAALSTVRNFVKYSFQNYDHLYIHAGWNGRSVTNCEREEVTRLYDKWRSGVFK
jgi:hypothetical protein